MDTLISQTVSALHPAVLLQSWAIILCGLIPFMRGSLIVIIQKSVFLPCLTGPEIALVISCTLTATCAQSCGTFLEATCFFFGSQKYAASSIWNDFLLAFYIGRILEEKSFVSGMRDVGGLLFTEAFFTVTACCYRNKGQKKKVQQPLQYLLLTLKHWMIDPGRPCGVFQFLCISE